MKLSMKLPMKLPVCHPLVMMILSVLLRSRTHEKTYFCATFPITKLVARAEDILCEVLVGVPEIVLRSGVQL
jgi:hypothetical protein